jgi:hypothetical protein
MSKPLPPRPEPASAEKRPATAAAAPKPKPPKKPSPWPWGPWLRALVSLLLAFHVVAVFSAPWVLQYRNEEPPWPPDRPWLYENGRMVPRDQVSRAEHPPLRTVLPEALAGPESPFPLIYHYTNLLYINNGYDFFSPDPVGSFIVRYQVLDTMGQPIKEGAFPDRNVQWPRLLYHRYMMLADQAMGAGARTEKWKQLIAERLLKEFHGASVRLTVQRHHLLTPAEVLEGHRQDEPWTYQELNKSTHAPRLPSPADGAAARGGASEPVAIPGGGR